MLFNKNPHEFVMKGLASTRAGGKITHLVWWLMPTGGAAWGMYKVGLSILGFGAIR